MPEMKFLNELKLPLTILGVAAFASILILVVSSQEKVPISNKGFEKVDVEVRGQHVYLRKECKAVLMVVSESQARSISQALAGGLGRRPGTHDLILDILNGYQVQALMARVHSLKSNTYYANLYLRRGNKILKLDSRPSDAIATVLRADAPVYVKEELLEKYGTRVC